METIERSVKRGDGPLGSAIDPSEHTAQSVSAQRTLRHPISCVGIGRHSGARVSLTLHPAATGSGIRFRRSDRQGGAMVTATPGNLMVADHALVLADGEGTRVAGVEHLVAALAMTDIDNVTVDVNGPELPAMDGSAQPFVFLVECAGTVEQDAVRQACPVPSLVHLRRGGAVARIAPAQRPRLEADLTGTPCAAFGPARHAVALDRAALRHELAAARKPMTTEELDTARERGLARGASLSNTLVLTASGPANPGGLRFDDEAARHANLLALGALYLLGGLPPVVFDTCAADYALLARALRHCLPASESTRARHSNTG